MIYLSNKVEDAESPDKGGDLYKWAFRVGSSIVCSASEKYGEEGAENYILRIIKELRNERMPERFRFKLASILTDAMNDLRLGESFPRVLKTREKLRLDEFYRLSSLILMGLWDSYSAFLRDKDKLCSSKKGGE